MTVVRFTAPRTANLRVLLACFACALCSALSAQSGWTKITPPTNADLWGVCYGGNQFVAVGTDGTLLTSSNGTAWTPRASGTTRWLTAVAYGNGTYVAVGDGGIILTSTDAVSWTVRAATGDRLNGIAYGNGRFVAVGENGTVRSSSDVVNWTTTKLPIDSWLRAITYGPDSFWIASGDGTLCYTADGIVFRYSRTFDPTIEAIAYSSGITVLVGSDSQVVASSDRAAWVGKLLPLKAHLRGVTKFGSAMLAVGEGGAVISTDFDTAYASASTATYTLENQNLNAVTAGQTGAVIVGNRGSVFLSSLGAIVPPTISGTRLSSNEVYLGGSITLSAEISGSPPTMFQWTREGVVINNGTTDTLVLNSITANDAGSYTLTVSNSAGSASTVFSVPAPVRPPSTTVSTTFHTSSLVVNAYDEARGFLGLPNGQILWGLGRLNADGSWDLTFHTTEALWPSGSSVPQSDGKLLVLNEPPGGPRRIKRLNVDGTTDGTFVTDADYGSPTVLSDGKLLCVSSSGGGATSVTITRLNTNGSRDTAFPPFTVPAVFSPEGHGIYVVDTITSALDDRGRVYVALASSGFHDRTAGTYLFRLSSDGALDQTFTPKAILYTTIFRMEWIRGKLCCQSTPLHEPGAFELGFFKLTETGEIDPSFASKNYAAADFDEEGGLVAVNPGDASVELVRYNGHGHLEETFPIKLTRSGEAIFRLKRLADGAFLAIGNFTSLNEVPTAGLGRLSVATKDPATHLANLSIRTTAGSGDQTLIAGFVVAGASGSRSVLVRGVGPGLVPLGINSRDVIADPQLTIFKGSSSIARNEDWDTSLESSANALGAFPLPRNSKDAALLSVMAPGAYTAHVTSSNNASGTALLELYDADAAPASSTAARLVNISGRAHVGTGDNVLIAGFVLSGNSTKRLLIRAIGPGLKKQGLTDVLSDPELLVYQNNRVVLSNDDWNASDASIFTAVGAFPLDSGSKDAALIIDLPAGVYTALVHGVGGSTGSALVEIYEVP